MIRRVPPVSDVAVIGAGVAGLAAAVEARASGADVVVFEAAATCGGASAMSGGASCIVDSALQRSLGITDSVAIALEDWRAAGGPLADLEWAEAYLRDSNREVYQWCESLGTKWIAVGQPEGNSVARWHTPAGWGRQVIEALVDRCTADGVDVRCSCRVTGMSISGDGPNSVTFEDARGPRLLSAHSVIVCTGGFVANHDLVLKYGAACRRAKRILSSGSPSASGSGHELLAEAAASFANLEQIVFYPDGTPDPRDPHGIRGVGVRGLAGDVWVNSEGCRFHDESLRGAARGTAALLAQPDETAWSIFNAAEIPKVRLIGNEYFGGPGGAHPDTMPEFWATSRYVRRSDSVTGLARAIGMSADQLEQTISRFNDDIGHGRERDSCFSRDLRGLQKIEGPGLTAIQIFPMAQKNLGGVRTDQRCQVLGHDGSALDGLFAAGEVAGMAGGHINGSGALEGTMFGPSLYSGRIAGRSAADHARHRSHA